MQLRWTEEAEADLRRIADYLFEHAQEHAPRIVQAIYDVAAALLIFPGRGRPGKNKARASWYLLPYRTWWSTSSPATLSMSPAFCMARRGGRKGETPGENKVD